MSKNNVMFLENINKVPLIQYIMEIITLTVFSLYHYYLECPHYGLHNIYYVMTTSLNNK